MKPEIRDQWIAALLSGNYKQTQAQLRSVANPDCYCCLGVLTDLYLKDTHQDWMLQAGVDEENPDQKHYLCHNHYLDIPPEVVEWAGMYERDPVVIYDDHGWGLMGLNDDVGLSFAEIADIIDEQL